MTQLIHAENLSVIHNCHAILENVHITINEYDFITRIGSNDAGKSNLLKCLIGIQKPRNYHYKWLSY